MLKDQFLFFGALVGHNHDYLYLAHFLFVALLCIVLGVLATRSMRIVPGLVQNIGESYVSFVLSMGKDVLEDEKLARKYLPLVATIGLVVFFGNIIGIIPGFESPTASLTLTLALAVCVFVYYNFEGIRVNGFFGYFKHFFGPMLALAPIMFIVEVLSHLSRIISLSFRLFGNIKGDDLFLIILLTLVPWFVAPLIPFGLLIFMGFLQAFIFMILTYVYIAGAVVIDEE